MKNLEDLLTELPEHPELLTQVHSTLLQAELYCLGYVSDESDHQDEIHITEWQDSEAHAFVPCFTSLETLSEAVEQDEQYLVLQGRDLFELVQGTTVIINPELPSEYCLSPEELEDLV